MKLYSAVSRALDDRWPILEFRRIAELVELKRGTQDLPLLSLASDGSVTPRGVDARQEPTAVYSERYWCVHPGQLVVNPMWLIGGGIGVSSVSGAVSPDYRVYQFDDRLDPRFVHHLVRSAPYRDQYRLLIRAETTFDRRITKADFAGIPIPAPPITIQRAIADYLDRETARIDALIAAKTSMLALVEERWRSLRSFAILRGCDPVTGRGWPPVRWDVRNLGATVTLQRGHDLPSDSRVPGDVPVVSSGGVSGTHNRAACRPPGVVTGRYGTIGNTYYLDEPYWPLNTTLFVSDFRRNDARWIFHMLAALPLAIDEEKSAVTGINRNVVGALRVPVPPLSEQKEIATELDRASQNKGTTSTRIRSQIDLLRERREALVTAAVTGNLSIPMTP